jgi:hypothetical protein
VKLGKIGQDFNNRPYQGGLQDSLRDNRIQRVTQTWSVVDDAVHSRLLKESVPQCVVQRRRRKRTYNPQLEDVQDYSNLVNRPRLEICYSYKTVAARLSLLALHRTGYTLWHVVDENRGPLVVRN